MQLHPGRALARASRAIVTGLVALVILFEEWGWEPLQRLGARLFRLPLLRWIEAAIAAPARRLVESRQGLACRFPPRRCRGSQTLIEG